MKRYISFVAFLLTIVLLICACDVNVNVNLNTNPEETATEEITPEVTTPEVTTPEETTPEETTPEATTPEETTTEEKSPQLEPACKHVFTSRIVLEQVTTKADGKIANVCGNCGGWQEEILPAVKSI